MVRLISVLLVLSLLVGILPSLLGGETVQAAVTDRYWVGDGGNWSDNATHWSASSGGTPGASLPTDANNVYFDANSFTIGGQTVTLTATSFCLDMDWTGVTNTPDFVYTNEIMLIYGSLTIENMIWTNNNSGATLRLLAADNRTITTNGIKIETRWIEKRGVGKITQVDDMACKSSGGNWAIRTGEWDTGGYDVTLEAGAATMYFTFLGSDAKILTMNDSDIAIIGAINTAFFNDGTNITVTANTANLTISGTGTTPFRGGNVDYNGLNITLNSATHTVTGSFTCATLNGNSSIAQVLTFDGGDNVTVTDATLEGTAGNIHTLTSSNTTPFTLTKTGGSYIELDYLDLSYSTASPVDTWGQGLNSTEGASVVDWGIPRLYIDIDGVRKDTANIFGVTIPNNSENWTFVKNSSMIYMETANITKAGVLVGSWSPAYSENFTDDSGNGNTAYPTYRTTGSNALVTASIASQTSTLTAGSPASATVDGWIMVDDTPTQPGELYSEGGTDYPGGAEIDEMATATKVPYMVWAVWLAFGTSLGAGAACYGLTHNRQLSRNGSIFVMWIVSTFVMVIWVIGGGGVIPGWSLIPYGFWCLFLMVWFNPFKTAAG